MQKYTFWQLIQNHNIEIPIIQRDYAQGRADVKSTEIRQTFTTDLLDHLIKSTSLELDFVYGKIQNKTFIPIDGQQRLTTLFLLHWYVINQIKKHELLNHISFSYKTRESSKEFTSILTNLKLNLCDINDQDLLKFVEVKKKKNKDKSNISINDLEGYQLSYSIINSNSFFLNWQQDPTVQSMLTMLDTIHLKFKNITDLNNIWKALTETNLITFHFLDLDEFELTDELYLKMNARGRSLTEYEIFKAFFQKHIQQWDKEYENSFSLKIDTIWSDLFWKHKGDGFYTIDYEAINYISGISMLNVALNPNLSNREKRVQELFNNPLTINPNDFYNKECLTFLKDTLDLYSTDYDRLNINSTTSLWNYCDDTSSLFIEFCRDKNKGTNQKYVGPTYKQRVLFFAQTRFFLKNKDLDQFEYWIRFNRNIVENTTIDSPETFVRAINAVNSLCVYMDDILLNLKEGKCDLIPFFGTQIKKEKLKATLILEQPDRWKDLILKADDHLFFKADIDFLFDSLNNSDIDVFTKRYQKATQIFQETGLNLQYKNDEIFLRILISQIPNLELLKEIHFDSTKDNLKSILNNPGVRPIIHKIIDTDNLNDLLEYLQYNSSITTSNPNLDLSTVKSAHEDLYKTTLICSIVSGAYLREEYSNFILYPYNAKAEWKKYIIGNPRNTKLIKALKSKKIELTNQNQRLKHNNKLLPYFWGWNIYFKYKNEEYMWHYKNGLQKLNNQPPDSSILLKELNDYFNSIN